MRNMPYITHDSSQIHSTHYDPVEQELHVRFKCACKNGDLYTMTTSGEKE
jgi:hypothetical protein